MLAFWTVCSFIWTQYFFGLFFAWTTASKYWSDQLGILLGCYKKKAQVAFIATFSSALWLGHLPLKNTLQTLCGVYVRPVYKPIKHSNIMVVSQASSTFNSMGRCQVLLKYEISFFIKLVSSGEYLKFSVEWPCSLWITENTEDQQQQMIWFPKSSLTVKSSYWTQDTWILCLTTVHTNLTEKKTAIVQFFFFFLAKLRCFWHFLWLKTACHHCSQTPWHVSVSGFCCTDPSLSPPFPLMAVVLPVACASLSTTFFPPPKLSPQLLRYSVLWTLHLFNNNLSLLVGGVNNCLLEDCQGSSLPTTVKPTEQDWDTI